jgi:hypothetical protein
MKEDKIERLLHAIEHPDEYSDEELQRLMDDEEVRDCYELAVMARQGFRMKKQRRKPLSPLLKIAAVFVGVLMLSGIAFAAVRLVKGSSPQSPAESPVAAVVPADSTTTAPQDSTVQRTVVFENAELEQILRELSVYYHVDVEYNNDDVRHVRLYTKWEPTAPLKEMLDRLNRFEKVNITLHEKRMTVE